MSRNVWVKPLSDDALERSVRILGSSCAASLALADLQVRRGRGEDAAAYLTDAGTIICGPRLSRSDPLDGSAEGSARHGE